MLTTVKGYYENGKIVLEEKPPIQKKSDVIVTFLNDENDDHTTGKRMLGILSGKITIPESFNDETEEFNER